MIPVSETYKVYDQYGKLILNGKKIQIICLVKNVAYNIHIYRLYAQRHQEKKKWKEPGQLFIEELELHPLSRNRYDKKI